MTSSNIAYLRENGPSTREDLPTEKVSTYDRANGVWKFTVGGNTSGGSDPAGGRVLGVWYLEGEHDREDVLQAFLDANPQLVEAKTEDGLRRMLHRNGSEWHDAINEVFPIHG